MPLPLLLPLPWSRSWAQLSGLKMPDSRFKIHARSGVWECSSNSRLGDVCVWLAHKQVNAIDDDDAEPPGQTPSALQWADRRDLDAYVVRCYCFPWQSSIKIYWAGAPSDKTQLLACLGVAVRLLVFVVVVVVGWQQKLAAAWQAFDLDEVLAAEAAAGISLCWYYHVELSQFSSSS